MEVGVKQIDVSPRGGAGNVPPLTANAWLPSKALNETQLINLYLNERRVEDVTILDLKGRERIRGATIALHESIRCLAREGKVQVLLDLAWIKHIDSGGLGELVVTFVPTAGTT